MNPVELLIYAAAKDFLVNRTCSYYAYHTWMSAIEVVRMGNVR